MDLIACLRSGLRLEADALGRPISVAALDRAIRRSWWALQHAGAPKGSPNRGDSAWRLVPHDASLRRACDAVRRSRKGGTPDLGSTATQPACKACLTDQ